MLGRFTSKSAVLAICLSVGLLITVGDVMPVAAQSSSSSAIKKCQDADGNWHYGDFAAQECKQAVVSELNESGVKVGEDAPPPTEEELRAREKAKLSETQAAEEEAERRRLDEEVVNIYGSEEIINSTRDRKLAAIDNNVDVTRQIKQGIVKDIEALSKRDQTTKVIALIEERQKAIKSYDRVISQNLAERQKLETKYAQILRQFRAASSRLKTGG